MEKLANGLMSWWRDFKERRMSPFAKKLVEFGISANLMTLVSLIFGVLAVWFLFENLWMFILFGILHLLFDALDGIVARVEGETKLGRHFDNAVDRLIELLIIVKIGWFFSDYFAFIVAGVFVIVQLVYIASQFKAPVMFSRTLITIVLSVGVMFFSYQVLGVISYIITGVFNVYSLARQLQWFLSKKY